LRNDRDGVTAIFADGSRVTADLLVGADGFRSTVRAQVLPDLKPTYAGYVAWRALAPEHDLPTATWAAIKDVYVFCVPEGELLVSYAVPTREEDRARGHHSYNVVWYRPADDRALADLCTDANGTIARVLDRPALDPTRNRLGHAGQRPCAAGPADGRRLRARAATVLPADL
jgi:2-polyprenyl-6-methoxyphenol hydroxylase-like FAD-dependent oxidoreductase